jgi:hypothetical protein
VCWGGGGAQIATPNTRFANHLHSFMLHNLTTNWSFMYAGKATPSEGPLNLPATQALFPQGSQGGLWQYVLQSQHELCAASTLHVQDQLR